MEEDTEIKQRIKFFKKDISDSNILSQRIISKYIIFGIPFIFRNEENKYFQLKEEVAEFYDIRPSCVYISGSSKLGFSIAPRKLWRHINDDSDIDVFILDSYLFDNYWKKILKYYNPDNVMSLSADEVKKHKQIKEYFFKGWLRMDLISSDIQDLKKYTDIKKRLYNKYDDRKVSIGFFRNEDFFEYYHILNINNIRKTYDK